MAWTNLTFSVDEILSHDKMNLLDADFDALMNGDTGAPQFQTNAFPDYVVTNAKYRPIQRRVIVYSLMSSGRS